MAGSVTPVAGNLALDPEGGESSFELELDFPRQLTDLIDFLRVQLDMSVGQFSGGSQTPPLQKISIPGKLGVGCKQPTPQQDMKN